MSVEKVASKPVQNNEVPSNVIKNGKRAQTPGMDLNRERLATREGSNPLGAFGPAKDPYVEAAAARQADRAAMRAKFADVNANFKALPDLNRLAEFNTGIVNATATASSIAIAAALNDPRAVEKAVDAADRAVRNMTGELTRDVQSAKALYMEINKQYVRYMDLSKEMDSLVGSNDPAAYHRINEIGSQLERLRTEIDAKAAHFNTLAQRVIAKDKQFESDTMHAAWHAALSAVGAGSGGGHGAFADHVAHVAAEAGISHVFWKAMDVVGHH